MKLKINDKETEVKATSLKKLAEELSLPEKGIAVAVNDRMVPRSGWQQTELCEGDSIVIIKAVCGG